MALSLLMRSLLVMRHAKSGWDQPGLADHDRPLNLRGRRDAPRMGRFLAERGPGVELILSSTANRAVTTARLVAEAYADPPELRERPDLYHASPETILHELSTVADWVSSVMIVGHNPGMEELVEFLTGRSERLPTSAVVLFQSASANWRSFRDGPGLTLVDILRPKECLD